MRNALAGAVADLIEGLKLAPLWTRLGWDQTLARFRRTVLGPFWLSANLLAISVSLALVMGGLMGGDYRATFAHTIVGILVWSLIGGSIGEGANLFVSSAGTLTSQKLPLTFHVCLMIYRLFINFVAQMLTMWVVLGALGLGSLPTWPLLLGLPVALCAAGLAGLILAFPATRYRDLTQLVGFMMQLLFFVTPVFWTPVTPHQRLLARYNPLAHLIDLVRKPLLGSAPSRLDWEWALCTLVVLMLTAIGTLALYRKRVIFWL